jgi:hypothetical protein
MAITTYAELKTAIASWLDRSDLTSTIPDFITLFEAVANRRLRVRQMEKTITLGGNDSYTKVLLSMDGSDGGTTFTDSNAGGSSHTWTAAGNANTDTSVSAFGGASLAVDGTGDYISSPAHDDFVLGSSDFTIDCWVRHTADNASEDICGQYVTSIATSSWYIYKPANNTIVFGACQGSSLFEITSTSTVLAADGWTHIAVVRDGNVIKLFINGAHEASDTFSGYINSSSHVLAVGSTGTGGSPMTGHVDEFRMSIGTARWTSDFDPPAAAYSNSEPFDLPADYLQWRRVTWAGSVRQELGYVHPSYLQALYPDTPSDTPTVFTIEGPHLKIRPTSLTDIEFDYYQKIPALADNNTTNWLLSAHPDLYLFGSLVEAQMFTVDPEQAAIWKARRDEVFDEIASLGRKSQGGGAVRVMGPTP